MSISDNVEDDHHICPMFVYNICLLTYEDYLPTCHHIFVCGYNKYNVMSTRNNIYYLTL